MWAEHEDAMIAGLFWRILGENLRDAYRGGGV
jgi:hypothetical protein